MPPIELGAVAEAKHEEVEVGITSGSVFPAVERAVAEDPLVVPDTSPAKLTFEPNAPLAPSVIQQAESASPPPATTGKELAEYKALAIPADEAVTPEAQHVGFDPKEAFFDLQDQLNNEAQVNGKPLLDVKLVRAGDGTIGLRLLENGRRMRLPAQPDAALAELRDRLGETSFAAFEKFQQNLKEHDSKDSRMIDQLEATGLVEPANLLVKWTDTTIGFLRKVQSAWGNVRKPASQSSPEAAAQSPTEVARHLVLAEQQGIDVISNTQLMLQSVFEQTAKSLNRSLDPERLVQRFLVLDERSYYGKETITLSIIRQRFWFAKRELADFQNLYEDFGKKIEAVQVTQAHLDQKLLRLQKFIDNVAPLDQREGFAGVRAPDPSFPLTNLNAARAERDDLQDQQANLAKQTQIYQGQQAVISDEVRVREQEMARQQQRFAVLTNQQNEQPAVEQGPAQGQGN